MSFTTIEKTLTAAVATNGTFTVAYPDGKGIGNFQTGLQHVMVAMQAVFKSPADFTVSFGATEATITYLGTTTIPSGTEVTIQFDESGVDDWHSLNLAGINSTVALLPVMIDLGSPITLDADGLIKAATGTELPDTETVTYTFPAGNTTPLDGANQSGVLDVPRNITAAATHGSSVVAMTIVVTGKDEYGVTVVESLSIAATGTSQTAAGKKAFKEVDSIAITAAADAEANTLNMGWGDVLGLPVFLPNAVYLHAEMEDGATVTAGTKVAGVLTEPSATTGDVRGTYDPNSACNGSKGFKLVAMLPDPTFKGLAQYGG